MFKNVLWGAMALLCISSLASAQFSDTGQVNKEIGRNDSRIVNWASGVDSSVRGHLDYSDPGLGSASFGFESDLLGSMGSPFSLGDGGSITLTFPLPIVDGLDNDFVVFENAFEWNGNVFGELGFVEISTDGVTFSRMPAISRIAVALGTWDAVNPSDVYNLAGQYVGGTAFNLSDLIHAGDANVLSGAVDLANINYVRIVDVIGDFVGAATVDYFGNVVSDPYPTSFASGGMDPTGVAVINQLGAINTVEASWGKVKSLYSN